MYKIRCFEDSSRCTSDVIPSRPIYNRAKKLLSSISSVGRMTMAWDACEAPLGSSLDPYTSNRRRSLGTFTVSNFEANLIFRISQKQQQGAQRQTIDLVSRESLKALGFGIKDGYFFAHRRSIGAIRFRRAAKTHCPLGTTLCYIQWTLGTQD